MTELQKDRSSKTKLGIRPKNGIGKKSAKRVLLVDDENAYRDLFAFVLHAMGYEVTGCKDGYEAFNIFSNSTDKFHLVLTDYMMPNIDGVQLAKKIRAIDQSVPIVLCTGVPNDVNRQLLDEKVINALLPKPLGLADFRISIKRLIS